MRPCQVIVERLCDLVWPPDLMGDICLWRKVTVEELLRHEPLVEYIDENARVPSEELFRYLSEDGHLNEGYVVTDDAWNIRRARFFYDRLVSGQTLDPICIDNLCDGGNIYAQPVIIDGHHRLGASLIAGAQTIPAHYGGRVDLKNYLTGKRRTRPSD
jgi:hypothetical protein